MNFEQNELNSNFWQGAKKSKEMFPKLQETRTLITFL